MKNYVRQIHKLVAYSGIEGFFIKSQKYLPWLVKFIPLHSTYKSGSYRLIKRDGVLFNALLNDYMQWYVFADLEDQSWKKASQYITNNSVIIDVGANCGAFTLKLAQYAYQAKVSNFKIYAFEPNPLIFERLSENLQLNPHLQAYVYPIKLGLGKEDAVLKMAVSTQNTGGGRITQTEDQNNVQIAITSLDKFADNEVLNNIKFIKIDVEGFEPWVIAGGGITIKKWMPNIYIEITSEWLKKHGSSQEAIITYFSELGYELYIEKADKFIPITDMYNYLSSIFQYNLLAVSPKNG